jgi:hypothetical protein
MSPFTVRLVLRFGDVGYVKCCGVDHIVLLCCLGLSHTRLLLVFMNVKLSGRVGVPGCTAEIFIIIY